MTRGGLLKRTAAAALAAAVGSSGLLLFVLSGPAAADLQQPIVINEGQTLTRSYPPLGAADPTQASGSTPAFANPDDCADAPGHVCDLIPIHIGEPADPTDYVVRIKVTWKAEVLANGVLGSDDIDIYLWDDPPKDRPPEGEEPDGEPDEIMHSSGSSQTESVGIDSEPGRKFSLIVYHSVGTDNQGYNVNLRYFGGGGARPDESLEPAFVPDLSSGPGTPAGAPLHEPRKPSFGDVPLPGGNLGPALDVGGGTAYLDPDLADLGGASSLDRENASAALFGRGQGRARPPSPVSGLTVALWMTITPAVLLGAGAYVLLRRRPAALLVH